MSTLCSFASTSDIAAEGAEDMALVGGSALSCVLSGFFAAAGASPGVLLGPFSLIVVGFGAARAFDGRCRQPGQGGKRPRGFLRQGDVPPAARVAVPAATVAAFVALGYDRERRAAAIVKAGLAQAKRVGAQKRVDVLGRLRDQGAGAFTEPALFRPLIHCGGPSVGGTLTSGDFTGLLDVDHEVARVESAEGRLLRCPWASEGDELRPEQHVIAAIDATGAAAIACFEEATSGVYVEDLELTAPERAVPVLRGTPRLRPGTPLPTGAPIEIVVDASGRVLRARQSGSTRVTALAVTPPTR